MIGTVFGRDNNYGTTVSAGAAYRNSRARLTAFTRKNTAGILDDALTNLADIAALSAAAKNKNKYTSRLIDVFA